MKKAVAKSGSFVKRALSQFNAVDHAVWVAPTVSIPTFQYLIDRKQVGTKKANTFLLRNAIYSLSGLAIFYSTKGILATVIKGSEKLTGKVSKMFKNSKDYKTPDEKIGLFSTILSVTTYCISTGLAVPLIGNKFDKKQTAKSVGKMDLTNSVETSESKVKPLTQLATPHFDPNPNRLNYTLYSSNQHSPPSSATNMRPAFIGSPMRYPSYLQNYSSPPASNNSSKV